MLAKWKALLPRLPGIAIDLASLLARHPLERWLAQANERRDTR
ncbi:MULTISPECIES: hypothetical protein [Burkholderia]|nr:MULTISPECIES: hypothetical protein [Burkholderia]PFH19608.1 hypothetical protein BX604_6213 [Burkholderia sp. JKS000303]